MSNLRFRRVYMKNDDLKWHILDRDDNVVRKCLSPGEAEVVLKELWAKPEEFNFDFRLPLCICLVHVVNSIHVDQSRYHRAPQNQQPRC
jgi:hypothetical protein